MLWSAVYHNCRSGKNKLSILIYLMDYNIYKTTYDRSMVSVNILTKQHCFRLEGCIGKLIYNISRTIIL